MDRPGERIVRTILATVLTGILWAILLQGCSLSPERQDAIRRPWDARDAERAEECYRKGRGVVAGGCTGGGGP